MNATCPCCGQPMPGVAPNRTVALIREFCAQQHRPISIDGAVDEETAALIVERSPSTLANWRALGRGPKFMRSGRIRYRIEDLAAWLDADDGGDD